MNLNLNFNLNLPMAQLYINSDEIDTHFCINNFLEFLTPEIKTLACECRIGITNSSGVAILRKVFDLKKKRSLFFSIGNLLREENIQSNIGLIMANLYPKGTEEEINFIFEKIGKVSPFFYNFYKGKKCFSFSLVHPQSTISSKKYSGGTWRSNQIIETSILNELKIYQANHLNSNSVVCFSLIKNNEIIASKTEIIPAFSAREIKFEKSEFGNNGFVSLILDKLPCGNGKPLIMRKFSNGEFNISHG